MKVVSLNLNGIRSAMRKDLLSWVNRVDPDIIAVQETKAQMAHLNDDCYYPTEYHSVFADAVKKGYSGVGIYSRLKPDRVITTMGLDWADSEGRYVEAVFGDLHVVSIYFPSGSSGEERQALKYDFMDFYYKNHLMTHSKAAQYILCGDFNIVHKEIDIKNWKSNQKNSGCLPEERAWLSDVLDNVGYVDAFRAMNTEPHQYTWWSNRGRAWDNNVGWRIDYQLVSANMSDTIRSVDIYKETRFSDHAPCIITYDLPGKV